MAGRVHRTHEPRRRVRGEESFYDQALREQLRTSPEFHKEIQAVPDEKLSEMTASDGTGQAAVVESSRRLRVRLRAAAQRHDDTRHAGLDHRRRAGLPSGELRGISGKMTITVAADGGHTYELDYRIES